MLLANKYPSKYCPNQCVSKVGSHPNHDRTIMCVRYRSACPFSRAIGRHVQACVYFIVRAHARACVYAYTTSYREGSACFLLMQNTSMFSLFRVSIFRCPQREHLSAGKMQSILCGGVMIRYRPLLRVWSCLPHIVATVHGLL